MSIDMLLQPTYIKPIRTEADFRHAYQIVAGYNNRELAGEKLSQDEADHFEVLLTLIHAYEERIYAVVPPSPHQAVLFRLEQAGLSANDIVPVFGSLQATQAFLKGDSELTLPQVAALHKQLQVPLESLVH
jgi:HTH-type transcriptional regulator / antitoxin HigA